MSTGVIIANVKTKATPVIGSFGPTSHVLRDAPISVVLVSGATGPGGSGGSVPEINAWRPIADFPGASISDMCTLDGSIYAIGGGGIGTLHRYDPTLDSWAALASLPYSIFGGGLLCTHGSNLVYIMETGDLVGHTLDYTVGTDTWSETRAPMPHPVNYFQGDVLNGKAYIAGGAVNGSYLDPAVVQIYDLAGDSWTIGAALGAPRAFGRGAFVDGIFFSFSGLDATNTSHRDVNLYDPVADEWDSGSTDVFTHANVPPITPLDPGVAVLDGEIILVAGTAAKTGTVAGSSNVIGVPLCFSYHPQTGVYTEIASVPWSAETVAVNLDGVVYAVRYGTAPNPAARYELTNVEALSDLPGRITGAGQHGPGGTFTSDNDDGVAALTDDTTGNKAGLHGVGAVGVRGDGTSVGVRGDSAGAGVEGVGVGDFSVGVIGHATGTNSVGVIAETFGIGNAVGGSFEIFDDGGTSLGYMLIVGAALPADGDMANSRIAFALDDTPSATTLRVKAKDSVGTVRTATIPLT